MALPRANRLSLRFERERLTQTGKTVHGQFFTLVSAPTPRSLAPNEADRRSGVSEVGSPRFAILLSKKTAKKAVDRNKIKRITSSIIETILSSLPHRDYLIIPKNNILVEDIKTLQLDFQEIISKNQ